MQREIKFRAWDKERSEWCPEGLNMLHSIGEALENPRFIFNQYTGLKDKNGKEIYEGDVVKMAVHFSERHNIAVVEYHKYDPTRIIGRYLYNEVGFGDYNFDSLCGGEDEVIGNIYENPELVTPNYEK